MSFESFKVKSSTGITYPYSKTMELKPSKSPTSTCQKTMLAPITFSAVYLSIKFIHAEVGPETVLQFLLKWLHESKELFHKVTLELF